MSKRFEYRHIQFADGRPFEETGIPALNALGEQGWEVVDMQTVVQQVGDGVITIFLGATLKREVEPLVVPPAFSQAFRGQYQIPPSSGTTTGISAEGEFVRDLLRGSQ